MRFEPILQHSSSSQGNVKVALSRLKIPLNLPLQKGDFLFPPLKNFEKGGRGGFLENRQLGIQFNKSETDFDGNPAVRRRPVATLGRNGLEVGVTGGSFYG